MSNGAAQTSASTTYRVLRELGSRAQRSYAAMRGTSDLVVAQRFIRANGALDAHADLDGATPLDAESMALLLRDARCLAKNWHPNVARIRHVDLTSGPAPRAFLTIASELLDGATLQDLMEAAEPERTSARDPLLSAPLLARILLDVLAGLHALHGLRDGMNAPLGAMHGELCPANVVVGKDGVARIVNVLRRRPVRIRYGSEAVGYASPEALDAGGTDDPRADIYAVGAMLWEGLAGRRLYKETAPGLILVRQREGELASPAIHPSSPFARLADVALRALSFDPGLRYRGATEMAADLRKITGARLATGATVAARVAALAGDRIRMRRALLEPAISGTRRRASERSIAAAEQSADGVRDRPLTADELALAEGIDPGAVVSVKSLPPLPPPVTPKLGRPLLRKIARERAAAVDDAPIVAASQPVVEVEVEVEVTHAPDATENLIVAALATTTAQMRAVAAERGATTAAPSGTASPGDLDIPIEVTQTWNESALPKRRRFAAIVGVMGIMIAGGLGALLSMRTRATFAPVRVPSVARSLATAADSEPVSPPVAPPVAEASGAATFPGPSADEAPLASASASTPVTPTSASARTAARLAPPPPPPPPKPKKSIYEPDRL